MKLLRTRSKIAGLVIAVVATILGTTACQGASASETVVPAQASSGNAPVLGSAAYTFALSSNWLATGATVSVKIGGGPKVRMLIDTGSNGMVIARKYLGSYTYPSPRQPFTNFSYSSSGNYYSGQWVIAKVAISSTETANGPVATTVPMKVRAVDQQCNIKKVCTSNPATANVAMLCVGFDRGIKPVNTGPAINPFLNLTQMAAGTMTKGYSIGSGKLTLGLNNAAEKGFSTFALAPTPAVAGVLPDWTAPQTCLAVLPSVPAQCGGLLLDTGLPYQIIQVPANVNPPTVPSTTPGGRPTVAKGQKVTITMPGLANRLLYSFTVGGKNAPQSVQWGHGIAAHGGDNFMNISRFALTGVDYLYDATNGRMGFRWHKTV